MKLNEMIKVKENKINLYKEINIKFKQSMNGSKNAKYFMQSFIDKMSDKVTEKDIKEFNKAMNLSSKETKTASLKDKIQALTKEDVKQGLSYIDNTFMGTRLQDIPSYGRIIKDKTSHPAARIGSAAYLGLAGIGAYKTMTDDHEYSIKDVINAMAGVTPYLAYRGITN